MPDAFKNTNFAYAGWDPGVALLFDEKLTPTIQNVSFHVEFYTVEWEQKPLRKDKDMYFLPFKVTKQIIDDGYLKDNVDYKFWLSYNEKNESKYYCGLSKDDDKLTEPEIVLMEGTL